VRRAFAILPESLPPVGVNREQAAALVGISATLFDRLVHDGLMPDARMVYGRRVWDVAEIVEAFRALPHRSVPVDGDLSEGNPWDDA
jgi:hypothetical protein